MKKPIHITLLGPVTNLAAQLIGGATVSFGYLSDYLKKNGEGFELINTKKYPTGLARVLNPIYILAKVLASLFKTDVLFLNSSRGGAKYLAPILFVVARVFGKKFVFRPFGGNIKDYTSEYNSLQDWIFSRTVLQSDILYLQTKALIQYYKNFETNIIQLPTSRNDPPTELLRGDRPYQKRFVFLGYVHETKGIDHILAAAKELGATYTLDIYGPLMQEKYKSTLSSSEHYKGVLKKEEVMTTLNGYDVLILPTFYEGEGYPGVIIEAYSLGLPVISTDWIAIPEIIEQEQTGLIIAPKSTQALVEAIQFFTESNYQSFSKNARSYFLESFFTERVSGKVVKEIKSLFSTDNSTINLK